MATLRYDCGVYGVAGATRIGGRHESSIHCSVRSLDMIASGISASTETLDVTWIAAFNGTAVPIATWQQDSNPTPLGFGPA